MTEELPEVPEAEQVVRGVQKASLVLAAVPLALPALAVLQASPPEQALALP